MLNVSEVARIWQQVGVSTVPVLANGTKRPAVRWAEFMATLPALDQVERWWGNGQEYGLALICGAVSGHLEMTELEAAAADTDSVALIVTELTKRNASEVWQRLTDGYMEWTPSGGIHLIYRISDHAVPGNEKIASDARNHTLAETRGEGGYVIVAPTSGLVHPTGECWTLLKGNYGQLPVLTWAERVTLHEAIKAALDRSPSPTPSPSTQARLLGSSPPPGGDGLTPGDDFEQHIDWSEILEPHGWTLESRRGRIRHWTRPGKDRREGASATTGKAADRDRLYVFSTSTIFEANAAYTKFAAYAILNHHGDYGTAARELARQGFGQHSNVTNLDQLSVSDTTPAILPQPDNVPTFLDKLRTALVDTHGLDTIPDPEPLVGDDIMFRDSLVWIVGKPGHYKSFVALDLAGSVGTGENWHGYRVRQGPVLYLVAEGIRGTKRRVRAWETATGRAMENVKFLPIAVQSKVPGQWAALITLAHEEQPILIVLDTQARVTVGVEENSNTEMGEFVAQAERLRLTCGACVMIVHHIGRNGDTGRGATTLDGAMGTIIKVTKEEDRARLECQKNKDGEEWSPIDLRAVPTGESIILAPDDGIHYPAGYEELRSRKWVHEWWRVHGSEPVSISVLAKSEVVSEATFHRCKRDLLASGLVIKEGNGSMIRYRLILDPTISTTSSQIGIGPSDPQN